MLVVVALFTGCRTVGPPRTWVSTGVHYVSEQGEIDDFLDDSAGFSVGVGTYLPVRRVGVGPELEGIFSSNDTTFDSGYVTVSRFLAGVRVGYFPNAPFVPYLRGGYMGRWDDGRSIDESGSGFYVGGGVNLFVAPFVSFAPQVLYTSSNLSVEAEEIIAGLNVDFHF